MNNSKRNYPKNVSGPTYRSQNTLLQTSIAVFFLELCFTIVWGFFLAYVSQKLHEKKNVFQNLTE